MSNKPKQSLNDQWVTAYKVATTCIFLAAFALGYCKGVTATRARVTEAVL